MAPRRLTAAAIVVVAAVTVVAVLLIGRAPPGGGTGFGDAVRARALLSPSAVEFGDRLLARVVVVVDPRHVDVGHVAVSENLTPLTVLAPTSRRTVRRGSLAALVVTTPVACLTDACLAARGPRTLQLPAVRVSVPVGGAGSRLMVDWPLLTVAGRVDRSQVSAAGTSLRADTAPPPPTYRLAPSTLATVLESAAAVLAVLGVALGGTVIARSLAARRAHRLDELTRALELVREAEARPVPDRRRALALLARLLAGRNDAPDVRDLAWSKSEPSSADLAAVVDRLEPEIQERSP